MPILINESISYVLIDSLWWIYPRLILMNLAWRTCLLIDSLSYYESILINLDDSMGSYGLSCLHLYISFEFVNFVRSILDKELFTLPQISFAHKHDYLASSFILILWIYMYLFGLLFYLIMHAYYMYDQSVSNPYTYTFESLSDAYRPYLISAYMFLAGWYISGMLTAVPQIIYVFTPLSYRCSLLHIYIYMNELIVMFFFFVDPIYLYICQGACCHAFFITFISYTRQVYSHAYCPIYIYI